MSLTFIFLRLLQSGCVLPPKLPQAVTNIGICGYVLMAASQQTHHQVIIPMMSHHIHVITTSEVTRCSNGNFSAEVTRHIPELSRKHMMV